MRTWTKTPFLITNKLNANRLLNNTFKTLKRHIHVKRVQFNFYSDVKNNLTKNEVLISVEIKSVYFGLIHSVYSPSVTGKCCLGNA